MNETSSSTKGTYKEADRSDTRITNLCIKVKVSIISSSRKELIIKYCEGLILRLNSKCN
ncbi:hypothetical protein Hdeb2414_s0027g00687281 [Helianthus debilis subsp. tardiflorus]